MKHKRKYITVFEHDSLIFDLKKESDRNLHEAFEKFFGKGKPYYSLIRNGVKFNEHVGVIQIGSTLVEVLPKADKRLADSETKKSWRNVLIGMLRVVNGFDVKAPTSSNLKLKNNSILDLYFELFINEVEYLLHRGLVKKYRKTEGNLTALKGSLLFNKQINRNVVHKERFFTRHTIFDTKHLLHIILFQTILVLKRINTNTALTGRINALLLNFPEMPFQKITQSVFDKLVLNRKTSAYKKAIDIARLILLHYHPDLINGRNDVLALMFDMNILWEQFVLVSLKKDKNLNIRGQNSRYFWKPDLGSKRTIRPDITIEKDGLSYVLDTKWKLVNLKPSIEDVRQMYAYHHYFTAKKVALLYPGSMPYVKGNFIDIESQAIRKDMECGLMFTQFQSDVKAWQGQIVEDINGWIQD